MQLRRFAEPILDSGERDRVAGAEPSIECASDNAYDLEGAQRVKPAKCARRNLLAGDGAFHVVVANPIDDFDFGGHAWLEAREAGTRLVARGQRT